MLVWMELSPQAVGSISLKVPNVATASTLLSETDIGWVLRLECHLASRESNPWLQSQHYRPHTELLPTVVCLSCLSRPCGGGVAMCQGKGWMRLASSNSLWTGLLQEKLAPRGFSCCHHYSPQPCLKRPELLEGLGGAYSGDPGLVC